MKILVYGANGSQAGAAVDGALAATQIWRDIRRTTPRKTGLNKRSV